MLRLATEAIYVLTRVNQLAHPSPRVVPLHDCIAMAVSKSLRLRRTRAIALQLASWTVRADLPAARRARSWISRLGLLSTLIARLLPSQTLRSVALNFFSLQPVRPEATCAMRLTRTRVRL
jgi:hypothetical protein